MTRRSFIPPVSVALLSVALYWPVLETVQRAQADYVDHVAIAQAWIDTGVAPQHFLYHLASIVIARVFGTDLLGAGLWIGIGASGVLGLVVYAMVADALKEAWSTNGVPLLAVGTSVSLLVVAPITLTTLADRNLYFGYISATVYHNPTITLLKPLALLLFVVCIGLLTRGPAPRPGLRTAVLALLVVASTLAKPSYTVSLLPALAVITAWALFRQRRIDWLALFIGVGVTAGALLAWQYLQAYTNPDGPRVIVAPLEAMRVYSSSLSAKFLLSVTFPAVVYVTWFRSASKNLPLNLAWGAFVVGAIYTYLLAESGPRLSDLNWTWSGQITLFVLFCASVTFVLREGVSPVIGGTAGLAGKTLASGVVYGLHAACGIVWWAVHMTTESPSWW